MISAYKKFQITGTWIFIFGIVVSAGLSTLGFMSGNTKLAIGGIIIGVILLVILIGSWSISKTLTKPQLN